MSRVLVLRTAGTNCEVETAEAFRLVGSEPEIIHVGRLLSGECRLRDYDILALPGGFSYGDDLGAGTVLANQLQTRIADELRAFVASGRIVIGICNGFQVLVRLGLLPGWEGAKRVSLVENRSAKFEDRWVHLGVDARSRSPLTEFGAVESERRTRLRMPVAHREGRFITASPEDLERLEAQGQVAFRYLDSDGQPAGGEYPANPNDSVGDIAGITNEAGNVLGLMPHPERFLHLWNDPLWTRERRSPDDFEGAGDGTLFFRAVREAATARPRV